MARFEFDRPLTFIPEGLCPLAEIYWFTFLDYSFKNNLKPPVQTLWFNGLGYHAIQKQFPQKIYIYDGIPYPLGSPTYLIRIPGREYAFDLVAQANTKEPNTRPLEISKITRSAEIADFESRNSRKLGFLVSLFENSTLKINKNPVNVFNDLLVWAFTG